ncbi:MAG TPA: sigma-70 family RNA polymerase sigma factor [Verrucomicrobiales bacterium]|nr:sigma-70 family RNA polymerase sigma factor [Verrucomicrobiales bacterium]
MSAPPPLSHDDFATLYAGCHLELLRYVLTLLQDRHLADDVVQETARMLWRKFGEYDRDRPFWPWARRFAHFEVLKARKRIPLREQCFSSDLIERLAGERIEQEEALAAQREALTGCMEKLDADSRGLLTNRYGRETTLQQLARQQGKSANALYLTLHRIRQRLVECVNRTLHLEGWT